MIIATYTDFREPPAGSAGGEGRTAMVCLLPDAQSKKVPKGQIKTGAATVIIGDKEVWADGIRLSDGHPLDAKHIGNPDRSPFIPDSKMPDFILDKIVNGPKGLNDEFQGTRP